MKKIVVIFSILCNLFPPLLHSQTYLTGPGLTSNYLPKYAASSVLINSLVTDNGTNVGVNSAQTWGVLNVETSNDNLAGMFLTSRNLATISVGGKYGSYSALGLNGTNITTQAWSPVISHMTGLGINTSGTIVIQGLGTELSNNESHIWFQNTTRTLTGLVSGFSSLFESQNSGGHADAVAGYRVVAPINASGMITNITNFYGLLIDDIAGNAEGQQGITNRWGIYQQGSGDMNYFNGNILLGTNINAGYKLDVNGQARIQSTLILKNVVTGANTDSLVSIDVNGNVKELSPSRFLSNTAICNNAGTLNYLPKFTSGNTIANSIIYDNGTSVGIGTTSPSSNYKLAVEGVLGARKIKVTLANPWADYVFNDNYHMQPLSEVELFIKENKHLPEIPTAKEVEKNGIDVGETETLLLKKVEELTLYMIQQNKIISEQNTRIEQLEKKLNDLQKPNNKKRSIETN